MTWQVTQAERRRETVMAWVQDHPGCSFRALCRGTGLVAGTARHHAGRLKRSGRLVELRLGPTCLLYATGRPVPDLAQAVALRSQPLNQLLEWLRAQPPLIQRDVLDHAAQAWRWPRATTQYRLARLVRARLVVAEREGVRFLRYHAGLTGQAEPALAVPA